MDSYSIPYLKRGKAVARCLCSMLVVASIGSFTAPSPSAGIFPLPKMFYGEDLSNVPTTGWDYDIDGDGRIDYRRRDIDGDGVVDRYLIDRDFNGSFEMSIDKSELSRSARRRLIICVDSIPCALMDELWREGHFRDFYPPVRLITTFPSDTNPSLTEVFGTEKTPGVEDRYYDREKNRTVGGIWDHMVRRNRSTDRSFHRLFEYEEHPRYGTLMYVAPYLVSNHDLARCRTVFWNCYRAKPPEEPILLYIGSTDAIGHKRGREGMRRQLLKIEKILDEIIYATAGEFRIALFSDHGNNLVNSDRMIDLGGHLARNGFRLTTELYEKKDVVVPRFGLVGNVCLYTARENAEPLAEALSSLEGVDFALYEKGGDIFVAGARGRARISRQGERYRYTMIESDPLGLAPAIKELEEYENIDAEGFADDDLWFEATMAHRYPDILRRAVVAMTDHVVNRPDVILSLEDGFCYGSGTFVKLIDLLGTHGSAADTQTFGMAMSTSDPLPDYIRGSNLLAVLGEKQVERTPAVVLTATPLAPTETPALTSASPAPTPTATSTSIPAPTAIGSPAPSRTPAAGPAGSPGSTTATPVVTPAPPTVTPKTPPAPTPTATSTSVPAPTATGSPAPSRTPAAAAPAASPKA